jgi:hypothetical protein
LLKRAKSPSANPCGQSQKDSPRAKIPGIVRRSENASHEFGARPELSRVLTLSHYLLPLLFLEPHEAGIVKQNEGTLDELAVRRQQVERFVFGHGVELWPDLHFSVEFAGSVEQFLDVSSDACQHPSKFRLSRRCFDDGNLVVIHVVLIEKLERISAGGALGVFVDANFFHAVVV